MFWSIQVARFSLSGLRVLVCSVCLFWSVWLTWFGPSGLRTLVCPVDMFSLSSLPGRGSVRPVCVLWSVRLTCFSLSSLPGLTTVCRKINQGSSIYPGCPFPHKCPGFPEKPSWHRAQCRDHYPIVFVPIEC